MIPYGVLKKEGGEIESSILSQIDTDEVVIGAKSSQRIIRKVESKMRIKY